MDVGPLLESDFVTVQLIKDSPSKKAIILSPGVEDQYKESKNLKLSVEIDSKRKYWRVSKLSLKNLVLKYGSESQAYVGKVVDFQVQLVNGKESVVGVPS